MRYLTCTLLVLLFLSFFVPTARAQEQDKLYDYLIRFAHCVDLSESYKHPQTESEANKLYDDAVRNGLDKPDAPKRMPCPSGLDKVTPLLRIQEKYGNVYYRLFIEIKELRAIARFTNHHFDQALPELEQVIRLCPDFAEGYLGLGLYYQEKNEYEKALALLDKANKLKPSAEHILDARARLYNLMGQHDLESKDLAASEEVRRKIDAEFNTTMRAHATTGDSDVTPEGAKKMLALNPLYPGSISTYAESISRIRTIDARKYATIAISLDPKDPSGYFTRADINLDLGNYVEASQDATTFLKMEPLNLDMRITTGLAYLNMGKLQEAKKELDEVVKRAPEWTDAFTYRSAVFISMGDLKSALADAKRAVRLDPEYSLAYNNLGACYSRMGLWDDAKTAYEAAVRLDRKFHGYAAPIARFNLGSCYQRQNKMELANREYDKVLLAAPEFAVTMFAKCAIAAQLGCRDADIRNALQTGQLPRFPLVDRPRIEDSIAILSRLVTLVPNQLVSRFNRALAMACLNHYDKASVDLQRFLRQDSEYFERAAIMSFLCQDRAKQRTQARTELQTNMKHFKNKHMIALGHFFVGDGDETKAASALSDTTVSTIVHSSLGYYYASRSDLGKAKSHIQAALLTGNRHLAEYVLALTELERICGVH